jgi:hypothetical protein
MSVPVTNNAVAGYGVNANHRAYSFGGIDSTLIWSGIQRVAYRYDPSTDAWTDLPPVPDTLGKIASGASTVGDRIYLIGGYHVFSDGSELSSDRVHIFDPTTDTWLPDGAPIPVPIDDHVQAVYRDSLIYVVTGWSNTTNVANVQMYNPALNTWSAGTPVPNTSQYKVFGASGVFVGDTLYYIGGARFGFNFPLGGFVRKGVVDPNDPTQIEWTVWEDSLADRYRGFVAREIACPFDLGYSVPFWAGGSRTSYNYNGLAYNGSGPVAPSPSVLHAEEADGALSSFSDFDIPLMDLRGAAIAYGNGGFSDEQYISRVLLLGGMRQGRRVWGKALRIIPSYEGLPGISAGQLDIRPTVTSGMVRIQPESPAARSPAEIMVVDIHGRVVFQQRVSPPANIDLSGQEPGIYHVVLARDNKRWQGRVVVAR